MAIEPKEESDFEWITPSRARVLRELADIRSEREGAERLGISYSGFRSIVGDVKRFTGHSDVREIGRWWSEMRPDWLAWMAKQGATVGHAAHPSTTGTKTFATCNYEGVSDFVYSPVTLGYAFTGKVSSGLS